MAISKRRKKKYLPSEVVTDIFARLPIETIGNVMLVNKFCLKLISTSAFAGAHLKQTTMSIPYLPPEILTNIFTRLPIETLHNVILVNKFCLKLISSRDFARAHLKHSKQGKATNLSDYRCIFAFIPECGTMQQFSFDSLLFKSCPVNYINLEYPKNELRNPYVSYIGSCDGLVCIDVKNYILLWNPCTGTYKELPCLFANRKRSPHTIYGFGYDESTDDYKVVAMYHSKAFYVVYVWSSKRDSWKQIQDLRCWVSDHGMGKLLNGKVHWSTSYHQRGDIVSFDVGSEVFEIVEVPSIYEDDDFRIRLDVLEGCICLFLNYGRLRRVDLWVMKEYGVKESWTKVVSVSCVDTLNGLITCSMLPNGEILFGCFQYFAVYDPKNDSFWLPGVNKLGCLFEPVMYVQSLVSPVV